MMVLPAFVFHGPPERTVMFLVFDTSVRYGRASFLASHSCTASILPSCVPLLRSAETGYEFLYYQHLAPTRHQFTTHYCPLLFITAFGIFFSSTGFGLRFFSAGFGSGLLETGSLPVPVLLSAGSATSAAF
jgi:hypothetical protein